MTISALAQAVEQAFMAGAINALTRRADALRVAAAKTEGGEAALARRVAQTLDDAAGDIGTLQEAALRADQEHQPA